MTRVSRTAQIALERKTDTTVTRKDDDDTDDDDDDDDDNDDTKITNSIYISTVLYQHLMLS